MSITGLFTAVLLGGSFLFTIVYGVCVLVDDIKGG